MPLSAVRERPDPRTRGVLGAAAGSALLYALLHLPLVSVLAAASGVPLIVQRLRGGLGSGIMAALLAASMVALALSPGQAVGFALALALPALVIGESMARGRGLVRGCLWAFALLAGETVVMLVFAAPSLAALAIEPFDYWRSAPFLDTLRSSYGWGSENIDQWVELSGFWHDVMQVIYPAAYVILAALVVLAHALLLHLYLARRDPGWLESGEFESVRWPLGLSVLFVLGGAAVALPPPLRTAGYNVLAVVAFFYVLQGLAVVAYFAHRLAGPPLLRGGLMVLVLLNPWAPEILGLLGLFDTWIDFRKWADPPEPEDGQ